MFKRLFLLVATTALISFANPTFAQNGTEKYDDWIRSEGNRTWMKFRGKAFNRDDSPATNCEVTATMNGESLSVIQAGNQFEVEVLMPQQNFSSGVHFFVTSDDGLEMATHQVTANAARRAAIRGIEVQLQPTRLVRIQAQFEGEPVADAHVRLQGSDQLRLQGVTKKNGVFETRIPKHNVLRRSVVWTDDRKLGGVGFQYDSEYPPDSYEHVIRLTRCRNQRIKLIDEDNAPIPNHTFELSFRQRTPDTGRIERIDQQMILTTLNNGEVVDPWFPDWDEVNASVKVLDSEWVLTQRPEIRDGILYVPLSRPTALRRKTVTGKLKVGMNMKAGFAIELNSFQHPLENRMDKVYARTNADGEFTAEVIPGSNYCVFVNDLDWISNYWSGVLFDLESEQPTSPKLKLSRGPNVEIRVTEGNSDSPVANAIINIETKHEFQWQEDGEERSGRAGADKWVTTNKKGVVFVRVPKGKGEARIRINDWTDKQDIEILSGPNNLIEFHRPKDN